MATPICLFWTIGSFAILCIAYLNNKQNKVLPVLNFILVYGKTRSQKCHGLISCLLVKKSWFVHFYIAGAVINAYAVYITFMVYTQRIPPPEYLQFSLNIISHFSKGESVKNPSIDGSTAIVLISMMLVQNLRRLYECLFVSVYSKGTMNIAHYAAGMVMYTTFHISILSEAPKVDSETGTSVNIVWWQTVGLTIFFWASWHQHNIHVYLSRLRKNRQGQIVSYQHYIPEGGWFNLVTNPHYLMEIVIYISFLFVAGFTHMTLWSIVFFVFSNQIVSGHLSHIWYKQQFVSYPKGRAAVIPLFF